MNGEQVVSPNGKQPVHLFYGKHACGREEGKGTMSVKKVTCPDCKNTRAYAFMGGK